MNMQDDTALFKQALIEKVLETYTDSESLVEALSINVHDLIDAEAFRRLEGMSLVDLLALL